MSAETVRRILVHHQLKPWRHHLWRLPHTPRDAEFYARVSDMVSLYTRRLRTHERVLCVDEKTSLQPRPRWHATRPAMPGRPHHGKQVREWLQSHPRFVLHLTPVHCSWLNQVEQWFSILQRTRLRIVDFVSKPDLQAKVMQFMAEWNDVAHPFNWRTKSVAKVVADAVPAAA
jgi:hypothetical protein